jgi:peptidoglycan/xylan/chitin deacetylase (PgdA/CDA1 family)
MIINEVNTPHKAVALTFDDGPNPTFTPQILNLLQEAEGKATFYMIGKHMKEHPEIVKDVHLQGHEIGNHTYSHPYLTQLHKDECLREITVTHHLIKEMTGVTPTTFRPPYLDYNNDTHSIISKWRYRTIGALNLDAEDWVQPGVEHIVSKTINHIKNGAILLFHDGFGDRSQTVEALRQLIIELKSKDYQLVTVSELLNPAKDV